MHPVLFQIGTFKVRSYGLMLAVAFVVGLIITRRRAPRHGFDVPAITDACLYAVLWGVVGARLAFIVQELPYYLAHPGELFSLQFQGLTSYGGLLFGMMSLAFWCVRRGKSLVRMFDLVSVPFLVAHAIGRVGCLLNGCCYGHACAPGVWGVHVEGLTGLYQPAQLYDSAMNLAGAGALVFIERKGLAMGQAFAAAFIVHGIARFIYEFWRIGSTSNVLPGLPISDAQVVSGALALLGIVLFVLYGRRAHTQQEIPA
ncbi:MAG: prolipoprotein diacylglyceryl transferase [Fimbriimonas ginsengisoli]|uniref:Phosphatidylglycerol--prolipoprotein diacylglyceryl transferase n=1 Tax=Fimbriimonas ginsengisoli TaxID=1005039 RepID=A0A931LUA8_FIMGI|nr:prolipoprotein diacylglyceryl transferase [Fimbriimonas ginsengisoli]